MRASSQILVVLLSLALATSTAALGPVTVYGGVGFSRLTSPQEFKASYDNGVHYMIGLGFEMAPNVQLVPRYEHHSFSPKDRESRSKMNVSMFGADARLSFGPPGLGFKPVLLGGIGLATNEQESRLDGVPLDVTEKETDFYYDIGGGVELRRVIFYIRYVSASVNGSAMNYLPFTIGFKF